MTLETDPNELQREHKADLAALLREQRDMDDKEKIVETFIEQYQLPKDITMGELLEFCRKQAE